MPRESRQIHAHSYRSEPYPTDMATAGVLTASLPAFPPQALPSHAMDDGPSSTAERASTAWTTEDDNRLMQFRAQGMNWAPIAAKFSGKTPNACRKRHERLMERKNAESWDGVKIEELARAYLDCREQMWKLVAARVGEKWQTVEIKCMEKGLKTLQTVGRARHGTRRPHSPLSRSDHEFDELLEAGHDPSQHGMHTAHALSYAGHPYGDYTAAAAAAAAAAVSERSRSASVVPSNALLASNAPTPRYAYAPPQATPPTPAPSYSAQAASNYAPPPTAYSSGQNSASVSNYPTTTPHYAASASTPTYPVSASSASGAGAGAGASSSSAAAAAMGYSIPVCNIGYSPTTASAYAHSHPSFTRGIEPSSAAAAGGPMLPSLTSFLKTPASEPISASY